VGSKAQKVSVQASAGRSVAEAEQDLWALTSADQPDNAQSELNMDDTETKHPSGRISGAGNPEELK
jgi:hypothetical protein